MAKRREPRPRYRTSVLNAAVSLLLLALGPTEASSFFRIPGGCAPYPAPAFDYDVDFEFLQTNSTPLSTKHLSKRHPFLGWPSRWSALGDPKKVRGGEILANWAAVGDSWSAGIGSGSQVDWDYRCARYSESYPMQLSRFEAMTTKFEFKSCTGDKIQSVIDQVDSIEGTRALITVSAGGNDLQLVAVINACIIRMVPGPSCADVIDMVDDIIESEEFRENLRRLLRKTLAKTTADGLVVWTGYITMFNEDDVDGVEGSGCDKITWAMTAPKLKENVTWWMGGLTFSKDTKVFLTLKLRRDLNKLVRDTNDVIRSVIEEESDPRAIFLEFEDEFEGKRYCERKATKNEGSYFFHPSCAHKTAVDDCRCMEYDMMMDGILGTPTHDMYVGLKDALLRITDLDPLPQLDGSTALPGNSLEKRGGMFPSDIEENALVRIFANNFIRSFHVTPAGNSVIAKKIFNEVFHHVTTRYFASKVAAQVALGSKSESPAEQARKNSGGSIGIACASDYKTRRQRSASESLFNAAINASCYALSQDYEASGSSLAGIGRRWSYTHADDPKEDAKVVVDLALFERGPRTVDGFWIKEDMAIERRTEMVKWHCEEMLKGILKTCDKEKEVKSGGASIDGRVIWRLSIQAPENSTALQPRDMEETDPTLSSRAMV